MDTSSWKEIVAATGPCYFPNTGVEFWLQFIITPGLLLWTVKPGHEYLMFQEKSFLEGEVRINECLMWTRWCVYAFTHLSVPIVIGSDDPSVDVGEIVLRVSPWVTEAKGNRYHSPGPGWMRLRAKLLVILHATPSHHPRNPKIFTSVKSWVSQKGLVMVWKQNTPTSQRLRKQVLFLPHTIYVYCVWLGTLHCVLFTLLPQLTKKTTPEALAITVVEGKRAMQSCSLVLETPT